MGTSGARGFSAGLGAGALAVVAMLVLRVVLDVPSLAELVAERITFVIPLGLFAAVLDALGPLAKRLFFLAVVVGMVLVGGLLGLLAVRLRLGRRGGTRALIALWVATVVLLLPLLGAGPFGGLTRQGPLLTSLAMAALVATYGAAFVGLVRLLQPAPPTAGIDGTRRQVLRLAGLGGLVAAVGGIGIWQLVESLARGAGAAASAALAKGIGRLPAEITPVGEFYTVSKNFLGDPTVDAGTWRLEIGGQVAQPFSLTYDELLALPAVEDYRTLLCISNEVGGNLIGNAHWRGVRLSDLLERAEPLPRAYKVIFTCADDYTDSVRLEVALRPENLLAHEMNGAPLIPKHGFPARLLVPGIYGMKNVKWVRKIEVSVNDYRGFWQQRGWDEEAVIKTMSRIDTVSSYTTVDAEPVLLGGVAFAGDRGLERVEYSVDDGQTWREAELKPPLGPYTWVLWLAEWTPPGLGQYHIKARARDRSGRVQTARVVEPLPNGSSGLHGVVLRSLGG